MKHLLFVLSICSTTFLFVQKADSILKSKSTEPVYRVVQVMPQFPGGKDSMGAFIKANLKYPRVAREKREQGRVVIECVVDTDGLLTDMKIKTSISERLDEAAMKIVDAMPDFSPGKQGGKPVKVIIDIPIEFKLPKD